MRDQTMEARPADMATGILPRARSSQHKLEQRIAETPRQAGARQHLKTPTKVTRQAKSMQSGASLHGIGWLAMIGSESQLLVSF